jgi:para-nitrobenzyl esterase
MPAGNPSPELEDAAMTDAAPIAETAFGRVRGFEDLGVKVFRGVPYAATTAGANRFRPPQPREPWAGVREATRYGLRCPQTTMAGLLEEEAVSLPNEPTGEDCLNLNVWTPALDGAKRPVMVWLHGGMFAFGSGAGERYDGTNLARKHDVVVVTVNHRLNLFGYLYLAEILDGYAESGDAGMLDCVAALEWVRDNIERFGGDPANVTVFGESGGGAKVCALMAMPSAAGLFHRAICQSGVAVQLVPPLAATSFVQGLLAKLDLTRARARVLIDLPVERLLQALGAMGMAGVFGLAPVVDGHVLPHHPFDPVAPKTSADVPMIVGTNETEVTFMPGWPLEGLDEAAAQGQLAGFTRLDPGEVARLFALYRTEHPEKDPTYLCQLIASDWWLGHETTTVAERKAALNAAPAYLYAFDKKSPAREGRLRSVHTLEIPYVFDNLHRAEVLTGPATSQNQALADAMSAAWTAFARTGDPNAPGLPPWPPYRPDDRKAMVFGDSIRVAADPHPRLREAVAAARRAVAA